MTTPANSFFLRCRFIGLSLALFGFLSVGTVSCKKDAASTPVEDPDAIATVKLATSATLGTYLTDANGHTLYFFARDVDGVNTCTSATCNPLWPVYHEATIKVPRSLRAEDFATKLTADGRPQTTYKGWPLYYYAPASAGTGVFTREAAGLAGGNGIGGVWHVLNPDYGVVVASKNVTDKTTGLPVAKTYLTDMQGRTLYFFAKDTSSPGTQPTNCTGGCAGIWPAVYMSVPLVPSKLNASDFATSTRDQGTTTGPRQQLTYKGRALYYFAADNATRGRVEGHNLNDSGDLWFVATP